ncbi:MAG TPA: FAD-dependent oxidoreductase [Thermoanaerobaculia bacterium]
MKRRGAAGNGSRAAPTYWLSQSGMREAPPAFLPARAEVAVIGGGVIGVVAAYEMARLGASPLLLERRRPGWGASGRNAGLVLGNAASLDGMRAVLAEERLDADYGEPGHLALASSAAMLERMREEIARRPPGAMPVQALDRGACEDVLGMRIAAGFAGGRWMPRAGAVHPARLVSGLADAAARRGATIAAGTGVRRFRRVSNGDGFELETSRGRVRTRQVVLACGAASGWLWRPLRALLSPSRGQVLATAPLPALFGPGLAVDYGAVYWRQAPDGVVVLGGCHHLDPAAEATGRVGLNPRIQDALERFLPEAFPGLPPVRVAWRWAGIMDQTPDGRPLAGAWPDGSGLWIAAGFGGHGLPPALEIGRALARAVVAGERPALPATLDPARFRPPA